MILQWMDMGLDLLFCENKINVLILENNEVYAEFISNLLFAINNPNDYFVLYENNKKLNLSKSLEVIFSPVLIDMNNKRIQEHLFSEMKVLSNGLYYELKEKVNNSVITYLDELSQKLIYPIKFKVELDENALYKQYDVRLEFDYSSLWEKTINYIQIQAALCGIKLLVFINAKAYFTVEQLKEIYKCAFYNKINILMIENSSFNCVAEEKYHIIDNDKCFIEYE